MIRDDFDLITDLQSTCAACLYLCDLLGKPDNRQLRMPDNIPEALDGRISVRPLIQTQTFGAGIKAGDSGHQCSLRFACTAPSGRDG